MACGADYVFPHERGRPSLLPLEDNLVSLGCFCGDWTESVLGFGPYIDVWRKILACYGHMSNRQGCLLAVGVLYALRGNPDPESASVVQLVRDGQKQEWPVRVSACSRWGECLGHASPRFANFFLPIVGHFFFCVVGGDHLKRCVLAFVDCYALRLVNDFDSQGRWSGSGSWSWSWSGSWSGSWSWSWSGRNDSPARHHYFFC